MIAVDHVSSSGVISIEGVQGSFGPLVHMSIPAEGGRGLDAVGQSCSLCELLEADWCYMAVLVEHRNTGSQLPGDPL